MLPPTAGLLRVLPSRAGYAASFKDPADSADTGRVIEMRSARTRLRWSGWTDLRCPPIAVLLAPRSSSATAARRVVGPRRGARSGGPGFTPVLPAALLLAALRRLEPARALGDRRAGVARDPRRDRRPAPARRSRVRRRCRARSASCLAFGVGSVEEELVFRFAAPLALGGLTAWVLGRPAGRPPCLGRRAADRRRRRRGRGVHVHARPPRPGHRPAAARPVRRRSRCCSPTPCCAPARCVPGIAVHALLNVATVAYLAGAIPNTVWAGIVDRRPRRLRVGRRTRRPAPRPHGPVAA